MRHPFDGIIGGFQEPAPNVGSSAQASGRVSGRVEEGPTRRSWLGRLLSAALGLLGLAGVSDSGQRATTQAINEEGGRRPPGPGGNRPSTLRLGEEGGQRRPGVSSHFYYEDGGNPQPISTARLAEEGGRNRPRPTTQAVGEAGGQKSPSPPATPPSPAKGRK